MNLSAVRALFRAKNPTGTMVKLPKGKVRIRFHPDGRAYEYRVRSNYELAERLELIPHDDIVTIAERVVAQLVEGKTSVVDQSGAGDTVRYYLRKNHDIEQWIREDPFSTDEYGRTVSMYSFADTQDDAMSSWVQQD